MHVLMGSLIVVFAGGFVNAHGVLWIHVQTMIKTLVGVHACQ